MLNVNNNCSSGSSALYTGRKFIQGGLYDCVLALGLREDGAGEPQGSLERPRRADEADGQGDVREEREQRDAPIAPQMFGNAAREYMEMYGVSRETLAKIGVKNHRHSVNNPNSQFRDEYSLDDVLAAPMVYDPLTKLQCCPTSDGGAAVMLASERFVQEHDLWDQAVEIVGQAMTTDGADTFDGTDGPRRVRLGHRAAEQADEESGLGPEDVQVVELHDCFSSMELSAETLGLCEPGKAGVLVDEGATTYGGRLGRQPLGRVDLQGSTRSAPPGSPSAPSSRGRLAARRHAPGRRRRGRVAAQRRSRRRRRRDPVQEGGCLMGVWTAAAIITGGGRGIGREHALLFAAEGAKVVVNDLGGASDGSGADASAAAVVDEIVAAGGEAVANTDSVASSTAPRDGRAAVEAFGDLHVVVNNAGILRDRMLVSMTEEDFDDVIAVHLKGTFNLTRHAADAAGASRQGRRRGRQGDHQHVVGRRAARQRRADQLRRRQGRHRGDDDRQRRRAEALRRAGQLHRPDRPHSPHLATPGIGEVMQRDRQFDPGTGARPSSPAWRPSDCPFTGQAFSVYGDGVGIYEGW